ncbi:hypothetical protein [Microbacterium trichothecenolyticum]|uniref:Lipoprotein n=1 Tax=Microbacterium trichothecenolyticum TaxID=69370 RepID=A0ABU0TXX8_MICTR|nr:hypothetical protein [Microbacterium trichothecenolyticum]MDQ1123829.1 hypothetical protein [Microbacterium trichothecenolyticum]
MRSPRPLFFAALVGVGVILSACTGEAAPEAPTDAETTLTPHDSPAATTTPAPDSGPIDAFRAWWTAVRAADTVAACDALAPALQERMRAEYSAATGVGIADCAALIRQASALYAAAGMGADVEVEVASEQADTAVLEVTSASGDCRTVHLDHSTGAWMLTELSQECDAR